MARSDIPVMPKFHVYLEVSPTVVNETPRKVGIVAQVMVVAPRFLQTSAKGSHIPHFENHCTRLFSDYIPGNKKLETKFYLHAPLSDPSLTKIIQFLLLVLNSHHFSKLIQDRFFPLYTHLQHHSHPNYLLMSHS